MIMEMNYGGEKLNDKYLHARLFKITQIQLSKAISIRAITLR
jgi:hypothetical protein